MKAQPPPQVARRHGGLFRRRQILVPSLRGCLLLLVIFGLLLWLALGRIHPFLAVNAPVTGGVLVVEGWAPDYALQAAINEYSLRPYTQVVVTGGPIEKGAPLSEYKTYAELGAATLVGLGFNRSNVLAVPAPAVVRDRTFASAVSLKAWFLENGGLPAKLNVVTIGPHARRSRLLFQKAFGKNVNIGVIALPIREYNPRRWWSSSSGFRLVTSEALAYGYTRFLFRPSKE